MSSVKEMKLEIESLQIVVKPITPGEASSQPKKADGALPVYGPPQTTAGTVAFKSRPRAFT